MSGNAKRQRNRIFQRNPNQPCFYCGIGFNHDLFHAAPQKGMPGYKDFNRRVARTAEHLIPKSQGGGAAGNIVVAHSCCNRIAADRPIIEKYKLVGAIRDIPEWKAKMAIYLASAA